MFRREKPPEQPDRPDPPNEIITTLDDDLVIGLLRGQGFRHFVDDEGEVGGFWDGARIYFSIRGDSHEMLFIRTYFDRRYSADDRINMLSLVDEWNRDRLFPKVYTSLRDDGSLRLIGELTLDCEPGVTLPYLRHMVKAAVATSLQFAEFLAERT